MAALVRFDASKSVIRLNPEFLSAASLPPVLGESLPRLQGTARSFAVVCRGNTCLPPASTPEALLDLLHGGA